jgi:hypothetical protein
LEADSNNPANFEELRDFLRDLKSDFNGLSGIYFPGCDFSNFTLAEKQQTGGISLMILTDHLQGY